MAAIVELTSYPVKGCAGVRLTEASLDLSGLLHDRAFMIVDEAGVFRSQRRDPLLATIRPEVGTDGEVIMLSAPGAEDIHVDIDVDSAPRAVTLFGKPYQGVDQGGRAAAWISRVLGAPSRLVRVTPGHDRVADGWMPGPSNFPDSCAVHLLSRETLDALNHRIAKRGGSEVPMTRFRPNIVVSGWDQPHLEDRVRWLSIGDAKLAYAKLAIRCAVTLVDQRSGTKSGPEPLRTLAAYRRTPQGGVAFGAKFSVVSPGKLAVGDTVCVDSLADSEF